METMGKLPKCCGWRQALVLNTLREHGPARQCELESVVLTQRFHVPAGGSHSVFQDSHKFFKRLLALGLITTEKRGSQRWYALA